MSTVADRFLLSGRFNALGLWTLYAKETRRFMKVWSQTVLAPLASALLFYAIFAGALGQESRLIGGVPFLAFLAPGLIMMSIMQNAFANSSSSLVISKIQNNIVDLLMPPLSSSEFMAAFVAGAVTRGIVVGLATAVPFWILAPMTWHSTFFVMYHAFMASLMLGALGLMTGIWSEKFDHVAAITNFIITPLTFLSGTFYTAAALPSTWQWVVHANPFFYMLDGFRYGLTGHADSDLWTGVAVVFGVTVISLWASWRLVDSGYKLKA